MDTMEPRGARVGESLRSIRNNGKEPGLAGCRAGYKTANPAVVVDVGRGGKGGRDQWTMDGVGIVRATLQIAGQMPVPSLMFPRTPRPDRCSRENHRAPRRTCRAARGARHVATVVKGRGLREECRVGAVSAACVTARLTAWPGTRAVILHDVAFRKGDRGHACLVGWRAGGRGGVTGGQQLDDFSMKGASAMGVAVWASIRKLVTWHLWRFLSVLVVAHGWLHMGGCYRWLQLGWSSLSVGHEGQDQRRCHGEITRSVGTPTSRAGGREPATATRGQHGEERGDRTKSGVGHGRN